MEVFIFIAIVAAIFLIAIVSGSMRQKKRTNEMQEVATEMGLPFLPEGDTSVASVLQGFQLMNRGRSKKYRNLTVAETPDVKIAIFDYQFTTGGGKNRRVHHQTVSAIQSTHLRLPRFRARPEGMFDTIGGALGFQDIDFDDHAEFSKTFVLKSDVEEQTRAFFTASLLDFFAAKPKLSFEGSGQAFVFYQRSHRIKPQDLKSLLEDSYKVYGVIRDRKE